MARSDLYDADVAREREMALLQFLREEPSGVLAGKGDDVVAIEIAECAG